MDVPIHNFYSHNENSDYCVFYLREKCLDQEKLFELQEESLGNRGEKVQAINKNGKSEEHLIINTLDRLQGSHKGLTTYSKEFHYDFELNFKMDFPNMIFNLIIICLMALQMYFFMDLDTSLMRQSWWSNQYYQENSNLKLLDIQNFLSSKLEYAARDINQTSNLQFNPSVQ